MVILAVWLLRYCFLIEQTSWMLRYSLSSFPQFIDGFGVPRRLHILFHIAPHNKLFLNQILFMFQFFHCAINCYFSSSASRSVHTPHHIPTAIYPVLNTVQSLVLVSHHTTIHNQKSKIDWKIYQSVKPSRACSILLVSMHADKLEADPTTPIPWCSTGVVHT